ncbi:MAG: DUF1501 domain-containing protein [Armatimonadetes bacterium]|nr:DUF1501 domain-containing protein [Armatimonadota bacterium]
MDNKPPQISRRDLLANSAGGLGAVALACLLNEEAGAQQTNRSEQTQRTHFPPKAKRVIQIFCMGGVSHVDTFDYKPDLEKHNGESVTNKGKIDTFFGQPGTLMKSPFEFRKHGQSGKWVSSLLPHLAECVDDLTFIHSLSSKSSNHTPATFFMNSGFTMNGFPCLGAWLSYGLGSTNQNLPTFVVLPDPRGLPAGGAINWTNGFLPATHQGVAFGNGKEPIPDLFTPAGVTNKQRRSEMEFLSGLNREFLRQNPGDSTLSARIRAYELAAQMQTSIPEVIGFDMESETTKNLYGLDNSITAGFGRNCLLARRLLERGVRFVQVIHGGAFGSPRINWDGHEDVVENHTKQAAVMDKPIAGLLKDLKARGMLDDTLILWMTEFGRTPITQGIGTRGRDHHPNAFTMWMAGAGLKHGVSYGSSDEIGYSTGENPVEVYDYHATVLNLLGLDHKRLTYYHNGIQRRLTDVHGHVIEPILA